MCVQRDQSYSILIKEKYFIQNIAEIVHAFFPKYILQQCNYVSLKSIKNRKVKGTFYLNYSDLGMKHSIFIQGFKSCHLQKKALFLFKIISDPSLIISFINLSFEPSIVANADTQAFASSPLLSSKNDYQNKHWMYFSFDYIMQTALAALLFSKLL